MKIKPLEWIKHDQWIAYTPASPLCYFLINFEEGKYWGCWPNAPIEGFENVEDLKVFAQEIHDKYVMQFIED